MGWDERVAGFRSWPTPEGVSVFVRPDPFEMGVEDAGGRVQRLSLRGQTLDTAYRWLGDALESTAGALTRPEFDLPEHGVGADAPFMADAPALAELGRWFHNAHHALEALASRERGASPVRCWPHHFDIATLITLDETAPDGSSRTIGCGMTPGDAGYTDPYWYVSPWPYEWEAERGALRAGGHWHTEHWLGAVLTADRQVGDGEASGQAARAAAFLDSAVAACRAMHGAM
jgi:hypothetical protein